MKLYYRIVGYVNPHKGYVYYGCAWRPESERGAEEPLMVTEDYDDYKGARKQLGKDAEWKGHTLAYFDGEYEWSPDKGFESIKA